MSDDEPIIKNSITIEHLSGYCKCKTETDIVYVINAETEIVIWSICAECAKPKNND